MDRIPEKQIPLKKKLILKKEMVSKGTFGYNLVRDPDGYESDMEDPMDVSGHPNPKLAVQKPKRKRPKFIRKVDCTVCGDVANDHVHYGAIACYSCRAFFRRGVNAATPYYCSQEKNCTVTKQTRKHCQFCRFQKCLAVGMKPGWVMTEDDKIKKKEQAAKKKLQDIAKKAEKGSKKMGHNSSPRHRGEVFTIEDPTNMPGPSRPRSAGHRYPAAYPKYPSRLEPGLGIGQEPMIEGYQVKEEAHLKEEPLSPENALLNELKQPMTNEGGYNSSGRSPGNIEESPLSPEVEEEEAKHKKAEAEARVIDLRIPPQISLEPDLEYGHDRLQIMLPADQSRLVEILPQMSPRLGPIEVYHERMKLSTKLHQNVPIYYDRSPEQFMPGRQARSPRPGGYSDRAIGVEEPAQYREPLVEIDASDIEEYNNAPPGAVEIFLYDRQRQKESGGSPIDYVKERYKFYDDAQLVVYPDERAVFRAAAVAVEQFNRDDGEYYMDEGIEMVENVDLGRQAVIVHQPVMPFTDEESVLVDGLIRVELGASEIIEVPKHVLHSLVGAARTGKAVPYRTTLDGYTICMKRIIKFAAELDFFKAFTSADQRNLLLSNTDMLVNIKSARMLKPGVNLQDQMIFALGDPSRAHEFADGSEEPLQYKQIYQTPWASSAEDEIKFQSMMKNIFDLRMDRTTTALMAMIALFSVSHSEVVERERAIKTQGFFSSLLFRYLKFTIGKPNAIKLFPKYMFILSQLEEMAQIMVTKRLLL